MATTHHVHARSDPVGAAHRIVAFVAGAAAVAFAVVAIGSLGSSGETTVVDLGVELAGVDALNHVEPVSALLDGAAFERAVSDAVAFVDNGSALLDGAAFAAAVERAITAATN